MLVARYIPSGDSDRLSSAQNSTVSSSPDQTLPILFSASRSAALQTAGSGGLSSRFSNLAARHHYLASSLGFRMYCFRRRSISAGPVTTCSLSKVHHALCVISGDGPRDNKTCSPQISTHFSYDSHLLVNGLVCRDFMFLLPFVCVLRSL